MSDHMKNEYGWLIEAYQRPPAGEPLWLRVVQESGKGRIMWTTDANAAMRFGRAEDAEAFSWLFPENCVLARITAHIWTTGPRPVVDGFCVLCGRSERAHPNAQCQTFVATRASASAPDSREGGK